MVAQRHTHTATNRYPGLFRTVAKWLNEHRPSVGKPLRILSFGCSSGEEVLSLRAHFPEATILGCDTNVEMLRQSKRTLRNDDGFTFFSTPENIDAFGPFDAIFAMSVLCQFPNSQNVVNLTSTFPFNLFETLAGNLAKNVCPGGVLCLFNANYLFRDLPQSGDFVSLRSQHIHTTGFIDRFSPEGNRLTHSIGSRDSFIQMPVTEAEINDDDLIDCLHIRKTKDLTKPQLINLGIANTPIGWRAIEGGNQTPKQLTNYASVGKIASELVHELGRDEQGQLWRRNTWQKSSLTGEVLRFPAWFDASDALHSGTLTDVQKLVLKDTHLRIKSSRAVLQRLFHKIGLK